MERVTEFVDDGIEAGVEVDEGVIGPEGGSEGLSTDQLARLSDQKPQHLPGLLLQPDGASPGRQVARDDVRTRKRRTTRCAVARPYETP
jgi:hypothetical protein